MLHPGMASELARLESEDRRRGARRTGRSTGPDWRWSFAGAIGLLAVALVGPVVTVVAFATLVAAALLIAIAMPVAGGDARDRIATHPQARDRWSVWRAAEPDAEERRPHAA